MPRLDRTFNQRDLFRIFSNNLTPQEQEAFLQLIKQLEVDDTFEFCDTLRDMVDLGNKIVRIIEPLAIAPAIGTIVRAFIAYVEALETLEELLCGRR